MESTNRNAELELFQLQNRIQLLKERNKKEQNESKGRRELLSMEKSNIDVEKSGLSQYSCKDEAVIVENCYRKSKHLIESHCRKMKRKKLFKNPVPIYNWQKKNISSMDRNKGKAEVITLSNENIFSALSSSQVSQKIQKLNDCSGNCKDDDVVYLHTINSKKLVKNKEQKKILDHRKKCKINKTSLGNETNSMESIRNSKDTICCESFCPRKMEKQFKSMLVETSDTDAISNNQDIIYLKTVNKTYDSLNFNNHDSQIHNCSINEVLEVSCSKSSSTANKAYESSNYTVCKCLKKIPSRQMNIDLDYCETIAPMWDFTEEPVDFDIPYLHIHEILNHLSKREIEWLRSKGIAVKFGRWSDKEVALLHRNYKNFTAQFGINDVRLLLGIGRNKSEFKNVMKFWKAKHFLVRLGKDLNSRPLRLIYLKARFEFFPPVKRKIISVKDDIPFLMKLQKKYGNNWYLIAQKFHLSPAKCKRLFSKYSKNTVVGRWTNAEKENLIKAIKKVTKLKDIFNKTFKRIDWQRVAEFVPTRNSVQCYNEWHRNRALVKNPKN